MKRLRKQVELIVIRNPFEPQAFEQYVGYDLEALIKQAFTDGLTDSVRFYHGSLLKEIYTVRDKADVDRLLSCDGRVYAVVKPMGLEPWVVSLIVSVVVSVAAALLMPIPQIANGATQAPSPNNALAQRTNKQRLGGRIPDIFGALWAFPDLIAPTYSVYIDHQEVEYSYMCLGRGYFNVEKAYDDTTPINQVNGSTALVFNPNKTLNDTPSFVFGSQFNSDEATWSRLATKRYTSVNGQVLSAPDNYLTGVAFTFKNPNIIETTDNIDFKTQFAVGNKLLIEGADNLASGNGLMDASGNPIKYSLNGSYIISAITSKQITLVNPNAINSDWGKLATNTDFATSSDKAALSTETSGLWQGWFYTDSTDHDSAYVNIVAPSGLWLSQPNGKWVGLKLFGSIESELVDSGNNPIAGTNHVQSFDIKSPKFDKHSVGNGDVRGNPPSGYVRTSNETTDDKVRESAAITIKIANPYFGTGKRLRIRVSRSSSVIYDSDSSVVQEIKLKDFYGTRLMSNSDMPSDVTTIYTKTVATEGALAVKERKLRLLVQRYVKNWQDNDNLILSNRADDIIYHIARDEKLANLLPSQIDMAQIKAEIDALIDYFGTPKCAEFCYTFDDNDVSAEQMISTVAQAVFSQAYRFNNQIKLLFERKIPISTAIFNSHNILPDSFEKSESFGCEYDGVSLDYIDPEDDVQVTIHTLENASNPKKEKVVGVRNEVQAHIHLWRMWNKLQFSYKSCEFTGGDESGIVIRSNRITVADQSRADVSQGIVENLEMIDSDIVLSVSNIVDISEPSTLFAQTVDGNVDAITCEKYSDYQVKLSRLPSGQISIGHDNVVNATYQIASNDDIERDAYIVTEKTPSDGLTNKLTCINYTDKYYQNDNDFKNGLIS